MAKSIGRRDFLRSATAAGAGFLAAQAALGQDANKQLNVALIGAGMQGQNLLNVCMKLGTESGLRFKAVCDIWENLNLSRTLRVLERLGHDAHGYIDYRDMLDKEKGLDAAIIATPDNWHAEHTVACLNAGLHVYCEAPMANSIEGARSMIEAAKKSGKLLQIGHQRRSDPRYVHCFNNLMRGAKILGRITALNGQWNRPARPDRGWSRRREVDAETLNRFGYDSMHELKNWMWYKEHGSGPLGAFGSHQVDVFNWFLESRPTAITAHGGTYFFDPKNHENHDTVMAVLQYDLSDGPVSGFYQTVNANGFGGHFEAFMGDQGTLKMSESPAFMTIYHDAEAADWEKWVRLGILTRPGLEEEKAANPGVLDVQQTQPPEVYEVPVEVTESYYQPHLVNFFDAVRGAGTLNCPAETGFEALVTTLKINEAVAANENIPLKPRDFEA